MTSVTPPPSQRASRRPWLAALGQSSAPGWGYFYLGRWGWALSFGTLSLAWGGLLGALRAWVSFELMFLILLSFVGFHALAIWHAWRWAKRPERWGALPPTWQGALVWLSIWGGYLPFEAWYTTPPSSYHLRTENMRPHLLPGDRLWVNAGPFWEPEVQRGDLVVFDLPSFHQERVVARVIGLPGDTIEIREEQIYRNDQALLEPYAQWSADLKPPNHKARGCRQHPPLYIAYNQLYLMPDHRRGGVGSCFYGVISRHDLRGRVRSIYYSPQWSRLGQDLTLPQAP